MRNTLRTECWKKNFQTVEASKNLKEKYNRLELPEQKTKDREEEKHIAIKLRDFMCELPDEDIIKIAKQRETLCEILDYLDGAFYRHDPKIMEG